ncbi:MAG: 50S ribosomal protein L1 [Chloroflexi bacterium]|nr:50S ribosomal protein L1 [Chloroflexota bacterium]
MPAQGKRLTEIRKKIDPDAVYEPDRALDLVKELATTKFDETVECHIRTGVDPRHADQLVRGSVVLPAGTGKRVRVLAFAQGEKAREAEEAGADYVGADDLVQKILDGWMEFDVAVATPDVMASVGRLGRLLGPRGLLPNPRTGTVSLDIGKLIKDVRSGRVEFRVDKTGVIHGVIGKASFSAEQLRENLVAFLDAIVRAKPPAARGQYIRSVTLASTMGPGLKLDLSPTLALATAAA